MVQRMTVEQKAFRDYLARIKEDSQKAYDDSLVKLCGGALGVSFAFVRQFASDPPIATWALLCAWAAWVLGLVGVLMSHYSSTRAAAVTVGLVDRRVAEGQSLAGITVGGRWNPIVRWLNGIGWLVFAVGVAFLSVFVFRNFEVR